MAINIKDAETDRLARELAELTGLPITVAVRTAIEERLTTLRRRKSTMSGPDLREIIDRGRRRQTLDVRPSDEILGYGDDGLPA